MMRKRTPGSLLLVMLLLVTTLVLPPAQAAPQATTYTVDDKGTGPDANPGDSVCATSAGKCTLEAAVDESNADEQPTTIKFSQRFTGDDWIYVHDLYISGDDTVIDASEWWDDEDDMPGVQVRGGRMTLFCLRSEIYGLELWDDIVLSGSGHIIGDDGAGQANWFMGGGVTMLIASDVVISHNYFRSHNMGPPLEMTGDATPRTTDSAGTWIDVEGSDNTISHNLIQDNGEGIGIRIRGDNHTIEYNVIGTESGGSEDRPLATGIELINGSNNDIGPGNRVCGNTGVGLVIGSGRDNIVKDNSFGNWGHCTSGNGAEGIKIKTANDTQILKNGIGGNGSHGLLVEDGTVTVLGNMIMGNGGDGIYLQQGGSTIGGTDIYQERNIISGNDGNGIHLDGASYVSIRGNCIGFGLACAYENGNGGHGILLENASANNGIGGDGVGDGNLIGWNDGDAIRLNHAGTTMNFVQGNIIGSAVNWLFQAPNGTGISINEGASANFIGGLGEGMGNVILASETHGLAITLSSDNVVLGNKIGTDGAGNNWGNEYYGIVIMAADTYVSANEIAYNGTHDGEPGVYIMSGAATGNNITNNSIHDHAGKGIALAYGGNNELAAPTIQSGNCSGPVTGTACPGCEVEFYSDDDDEGKIREGIVTADGASGAFTWNGQPNGPNLTATNTDANDNTSEFSVPFAIGACNTAPTAAFTITPSNGPPGATYAFDASSSSDEQDETSELHVRWDWEADGFYDTDWTTTKTASRVFDTVTVHTIKLQVRDTGGLTDATTRQLDIEGDGNGDKLPVFLPMIVR